MSFNIAEIKMIRQCLIITRYSKKKRGQIIGEEREREKERTYLYGLKSASKPSGKSKITLICVPWDISPKEKRNTYTRIDTSIYHTRFNNFTIL
jgi:hypothetical protein